MRSPIIYINTICLMAKHFIYTCWCWGERLHAKTFEFEIINIPKVKKYNAFVNRMYMWHAGYIFLNFSFRCV